MSDEPAQAPEGYRYMRGFLVCARCGVLVLDRELHTAWHGRLTGPPVPYRPQEKTYACPTCGSHVLRLTGIGDLRWQVSCGNGHVWQPALGDVIVMIGPEYPSDTYPDEPASEDNRQMWRRD